VCVWSTLRLGRFTPCKDPVPIVKEAGWASEPVRTGAENLSPTGVRSPDRPARSKSLYRLRYPGSVLFVLVKLVNGKVVPVHAMKANDWVEQQYSSTYS
jgi:hypothetical protein